MTFTTNGGPAVPELFQFAFSHYNEKARWALDWKRVPHRRRSLLPGPHRPVVQRLTGQSQVPVLRWGDESCRAPRNHRSCRAPLSRAAAVSCARGGASRGARRRPLVRRRGRWPDPPRVLLRFLEDAAARRAVHRRGGPAAAAGYRAVFPLIRVVMRRDMKIDAAGAERGVARTKEALELVAERAGATATWWGTRSASPTSPPRRCSRPRSFQGVAGAGGRAAVAGGGAMARTFADHPGASGSPTSSASTAACPPSRLA